MTALKWNIVHGLSSISHEERQSICLATASFPAANHLGYLQSVFSSAYHKEDQPIAILYKDNKAIFALPIVKSKRRKFFFRWTEVGFPFHRHINLIKFPNEILENRDLMLSLIEQANSVHSGWSTFVIRNISGANQYKYSGDSAWFHTDSNHSIEDIVSKKHLRNMRRLQKKLVEVTSEPILSFNKPTLNEALDEFIEFENQTWKGEDGISIKNEPGMVEMYKALAKQLENNMAIIRLAIDDTCIGSALTYRFNDKLYIHKVSFAPDYAKYGPGNLLLLHILEYALAQDNLNEVNLVTRPEWSYRWHPQVTKSYDIEYFRANTSGKLVKLLIHNWRRHKPKLKALFKIP